MYHLLQHAHIYIYIILNKEKTLSIIYFYNRQFYFAEKLPL